MTLSRTKPSAGDPLVVDSMHDPSLMANANLGGGVGPRPMSRIILGVRVYMSEPTRRCATYTCIAEVGV